ncbi:MAG: protein kinase [Candidatus Amulumruptor caecigallinarius]|nr:protein kinase [Candidatus Amulumruptor caecigallinarius]
MKKVGKYDVEDAPIGSGGMGRVLKGYSPLDGTPVAIKEILPTFVQNEEYRHRIISEINFLKKLHNPNVVKVYDHFELNGNLYIVMELVEGLNVEQYVLKNGPIPWTEAAGYMLKLLNTMQDVHEQGIVHRDIKPGNIMLRPNGDICLLDFGVAKDISGNSRNSQHTVIGTVIGTDGYMSPEQAQGYDIDHRTDVYSLGCVLFFMITGKHAFSAMTSFEMEKDIMTKPFPRMATHVRGIPSVVQDVLDHSVDKNMMRRFQSCREFADQLMRVLPGGTQLNTHSDGGADKISIGRENCDICVGRNHNRVSRHHADITMIEENGEIVFVYTDSSSNGTTIDGVKLRHGDSIRIACGKRPNIYLADDPSCRLDMAEVENVLLRLGKKSRDKRKTEYDNTTLPQDLIRRDPSENFFGAIKECLVKYVVFSGRASRSEFWWFTLFNYLMSMILTFVYLVTGMAQWMMWIILFYSLLVFLPQLAVLIRRLHDVGKGWSTFLLCLIPVAGLYFLVVMIIKLVARGSKNPNKYGAPVA